MGLNTRIKKIWHFIWHEDSIASWIVNLILAFVLVKWVIYPGFGLILGTKFPIVAVVSSSMEHNGLGFDKWWEEKGKWYENKNFEKEDFRFYPFHNGFNKGDIMILKGIEPKDIKIGDVVVYESPNYKNPIIHRVVEIKNNGDFKLITKGDNNFDADSNEVTQDQIKRTGKAIMRIPLLGWIKIWFVELFKLKK